MQHTRNQRTLIFLFFLVVVGLPFLGILARVVSRSSLIPTPMSLTMSEANKIDSYGQGSEGKMMGYAGGGTATTAVMTDQAQDSARSMIAPMPPIYDSGFVPGEDRVIVKNANLTISVDDVRKTVTEVSTLTKAQNGVVTNSDIFEAGQKGSVQANLTLRVPTDKLDDTLAQIRTLAAKVLQDSMNADDRTKQKVDLDARLNNLKATEEQLLALMKQAKNVQETLQVQSELTNVRSQIEVMTAQLQNLSNDAAMSTIQVTITSRDADLPTVSSQQNTIWEEIVVSLKDMVRLYRQLFILGVRSFILLLPVIVIGLISWFAWKRKARNS
jgi:hypothetical protein